VVIGTVPVWRQRWRDGGRPLLIGKRQARGGTAFSMGGIWIGCNHLMLAAGYKDTREDGSTTCALGGGN
jgi:hypothetical protein